MIRIIDIFASVFLILFLFPFIAVVLMLSYFETGSPIFSQTRVGLNKKLFTMYKIRTMKVSAKEVPSHLADSSEVTRLGRLLRRLKLDEFPQLINVIKGEMSLVGARPCLLTQQELIKLRDKYGVYKNLPGITGYAQIMGVDMSEPERLAEIDGKMAREMTVMVYLRCVVSTAVGKGRRDGII